VAWTDRFGWLARLRQFFVEVWAELQKTTWPSLQEVRGTTVVEIVAVIICAAYLWIVDEILQTGMTHLLKAFGR
jgi:preprotein translocase subunit SecE